MLNSQTVMECLPEEGGGPATSLERWETRAHSRPINGLSACSAWKVQGRGKEEGQAGTALASQGCFSLWLREEALVWEDSVYGRSNKELELELGLRVVSSPVALTQILRSFQFHNKMLRLIKQFSPYCSVLCIQYEL